MNGKIPRMCVCKLWKILEFIFFFNSEEGFWHSCMYLNLLSWKLFFTASYFGGHGKSYFRLVCAQCAATGRFSVFWLDFWGCSLCLEGKYKSSAHFSSVPTVDFENLKGNWDCTVAKDKFWSFLTSNCIGLINNLRYLKDLGF